MKKLTFFVLMIASILSATPVPDPGEWALLGEYIFWSPSVDYSYYVIDQGPTVPLNTFFSGKRDQNSLGWHSGYHLEGIYTFCNACSEFRMEFTYLNIEETAKRSESPLGVGDLWATQGFPNALGAILEPYIGEANSQIHLHYYSLDALVGRCIETCCPLYFELECGVHYAHADYKERVDYINTTTPLFTTYEVINGDRYRGIGPEIGLDLRYNPYDITRWRGKPVYLNGRVRGGILVSKSNGRFIQKEKAFPSDFLLSVDANIQSKDKWRVVPMWEVSMGLSYEDTFFDCFDFNFEIGYEVLSYHRALQLTRFYDSTDVAASLDLYSNLDFQGPYVSFAIYF